MTSSVGRLVDAPKLVVAWLAPRWPDARVLTRLPADLSGKSWIWVASAGGMQDWDNAHPRVDVACLVSGDEGAAFDLMAGVHADMGALAGQKVTLPDGSRQLVNNVICIGIPEYRFWSADFDRMVGTYELDLPVYG